MRRIGAKVVVVLALLGIAASAAAQSGEIGQAVETPRGVGLGSGVRASAISSSALAYNPAGLGIGRLYHVEGLTGYEPKHNRWSLGGAVVDSMTSPLGAGLSLRGVVGGKKSEYKGFDGKIGIGVPLGDVFAVGIAGRYLNFNPKSRNDPAAEDYDVSRFTMDAAIRLNVASAVQIAIVGNNLIPTKTALAPVLLGGSVAFSVADMLTVGADGIVDLTTYDRAKLLLGGGIEYLATGMVPLRIGYLWDQGSREHFVTGSVGYVNAQFGTDIALRQGVSGEKDTQLVLGVRYHVF